MKALILVFITGGLLATGVQIAYEQWLSPSDPQEKREVAEAQIGWAEQAFDFCDGMGFGGVGAAREHITLAKELFKPGTFEQARDEAIRAREALPTGCPYFRDVQPEGEQFY